MIMEFHVLPEVSKTQQLHYICKLIAAFYAKNTSILVSVYSAEEANYLDQMLWTYQEDSFIPHHLSHENNDCSTPIHISHAPASHLSAQVIINWGTLAFDIPLHSQRVEIVFSDPTMQQLARERYKKYRALGIDITTHKIKVNEL